MSYFHADRIVTTGQVLTGGWLRADDGWISEIGSGKVPSNSHYLGELMLPGFVDIHCHGGAGKAFTDGATAAQEVAEFHLRHGTTSMLASTVSTAIPELVGQIRELADHITADQNQPIKGIHLEGPFLSHEYRGAHFESSLCDPEAALVAQLLAAGPISMVTLAPELPGGIRAVDQIVRSGAIAAVGHTGASYEQVTMAAQHGARVLTHACNAMAPTHHRAPGPLLAAIHAGMCLELILDGVHLHDGMARTLLEYGADRCILITDAMAAAGAPDGRYQLGPRSVAVTDRVARLDDGGAIAGSTLTMDRAVARALAIGKNPIAVARAASTVPAQLMKWSDVGDIAVSKRADFVGLSGVDAGEPELVVVRGGVLRI